MKGGRQKMKFDSANLLGKILTVFGSRAEFAEAMGISRPTLQKKLKDGSFSLFEIEKAKALLDIPNEEQCNYFHFF